MIDLKNVCFYYPESTKSALKDINVKINKGEVILICGESGCGKTTITRLINGLIPYFYKGTSSGEVLINGVDVCENSIYETSKKVGSVFQNPRSQFFNLDTTSVYTICIKLQPIYNNFLIWEKPCLSYLMI